MQRSSCMAAACLVFVIAVTYSFVPAQADPLPGQILKFQQLPLNNGGPIPAPYTGPYISPNTGGPFPPLPVAPLQPVAPFPGHDELSTAYAQFDPQNHNFIGWQGQYMADDFADRFESPVVHVRWWGSYMQNSQFAGVKKFLISFESDVPASPTNPFSHPGAPLLNQIVTIAPTLAPGSGTYTETPVPTPTGPIPPIEPLYQYNAELHLGKEFPELANTVYWLKIVALVDPGEEGPIQWGWHNRDWMVPDYLASVPPAVIPGEGPIGGLPGFGPVWHFQDDAVTGPLTIVPTANPISPEVSQQTWAPQNYVFPFDGPDGIQNFSKDLAFELYTVPEPGTLALLGFMTMAGCMIRSRRQVC